MGYKYPSYLCFLFLFYLLDSNAPDGHYYSDNHKINGIVSSSVYSIFQVYVLNLALCSGYWVTERNLTRILNQPI